MSPLDSVQAAQDSGYAMSVTVHDVAPATQARCEALIADLERIAPLPFTLLVVRHHQQRERQRCDALELGD